MSVTYKPYSSLVDTLIPDYIKEDYPNYVLFIKRYFLALETETGPMAVVNDLTKFIDVSRVPDEQLSHLINQYLNSFPMEEFNDINVRTFIQNSKDFYSKKGTENALQFIFKLLNGSLELYYPADDIFHLNYSCPSGLGTVEDVEQLHYIHDNEYYAYYVYEIRSDQDIDKYQEIVEKQIHPVGTKVVYVKEDFDYWLKFNYTEASQYITLM
jgi:hypothetical protein